ncbi:hypothetical protein [Streptomyces sp. NPDC010273]|uniref:hypothetical protein n=1 Tax=Streptomyces sp. NPDC010273 TaxID=3364829 RepID=UPI0036EA7FF4
MEQKPSVGRMVHYVSYGTPGGEYTRECRAAIVTEVDAIESYRVGLAVLNPTGQFFHSLGNGGCMADFTENQGGTWHWPERV